MRLAVIGSAGPQSIEISAVVFHDDDAHVLRLHRTDGDMKGCGIRIHAVLDGIFDDGLQRQRRHAEVDMRRVVVDEQEVLELRLFYGKICARVRQLFGKGDGLLTRDRGEVLPQIGGEIKRDLLRQIWRRRCRCRRR